MARCVVCKKNTFYKVYFDQYAVPCTFFPVSSFKPISVTRANVYKAGEIIEVITFGGNPLASL